MRPEMKRHAAVEPVIGHLKANNGMGRNHFKGCDGDHANGYNFALPLCWYRFASPTPRVSHLGAAHDLGRSAQPSSVASADHKECNGALAPLGRMANWAS